MTFSNFEKYSAGKLNNHSSEVDIEGLWNDILPHVQNDNKRKRGLIWFLFFGLLVSFAGIYALYENDPSGPEKEIIALSSAGAIIENNDSDSNKNIEKEITAISDSENENSNSESETIQVSKKQKTPEQTNSTVKVENQKYKATNNQVQTNNSKAGKLTSDTAINKTGENVENEVTELIIVTSAIDTTSKTSNPEQEEATPINTDDLNAEDEKADIAEVAELEEVTANSEEEAFSPPPGRNKLKIKFGVGVYAGISSSFASLNDKDGMNSDYLQLRLGTEEQLETMQMGLDVVARSKYGVYLKTGVQYSRIARKFTLGSSIVTVDSVDGIQKIYVNENTNDTIYIYGPVPVTTTTTYNKITYNYFHLMDIPLLVGYSYNNDNWSFGVEAGALFNISTKTKGEIMQNDVDIYNMKEDPLNWFTDNVGVSFLTSISIAYQFDENFQIYIAPTARLESVFSTDANPIAQKHGALGINAGVRYFIGY